MNKGDPAFSFKKFANPNFWLWEDDFDIRKNPGGTNTQIVVVWKTHYLRPDHARVEYNRPVDQLVEEHFYWKTSIIANLICCPKIFWECVTLIKRIPTMPIAYQEDTDDYNDTKWNLGALPHCVFLMAICYGRTGSKLSCFPRHSKKKPIQVVVRFGSDAVKGGWWGGLSTGGAVYRSQLSHVYPTLTALMSLDCLCSEALVHQHYSGWNSRLIATTMSLQNKKRPCLSDSNVFQIAIWENTYVDIYIAT